MFDFRILACLSLCPWCSFDCWEICSNFICCFKLSNDIYKKLSQYYKQKQSYALCSFFNWQMNNYLEYCFCIDFVAKVKFWFLLPYKMLMKIDLNDFCLRMFIFWPEEFRLFAIYQLKFGLDYLPFPKYSSQYLRVRWSKGSKSFLEVNSFCIFT